MNNHLQTGSIDNEHINIHEYFEVEHWAKELQISIECLKQAVKNAGNSIEDIKKYLGKN